MNLKCKLGFHNWSNDCEKCSICGKSRKKNHNWSHDCEKCSICGQTREREHYWSNNCEKCAVCGKTRDNYHKWSGCRCLVCLTIRDEHHVWQSCICSKCGKEEHIIVNNICSKCGKEFHKGFYIDKRDGQTYHWKKFGNHTVMVDNLRYKPQYGKYWAYNNDNSYVKNYGYLYDWETACNIVPEGWHLPSIYEWESLVKFFGRDEKIVYQSIIKGGSSGFEILLGGCRGNEFAFFGSRADFWSSTKIDDVMVKTFTCRGQVGLVDFQDCGRGCGFYVRLFKD